MQAGAYHYVTKPVNLDELELVIQRALNSRRIEAENVNLHEQIDHKYGLESIIGESEGMRQVFVTWGANARGADFREVVNHRSHWKVISSKKGN